MTGPPAVRRRHRSGPPVGMAPLPPRKKWRAILVATLVLAVAFWSLMLGLVTLATDDTDAPEGPGVNAPAAVAFGLALIPFVFVALAFMSEHPRAPGAVVRAMGLSVLVGVLVVGFVGDPVTGVVAGVGAGGVVALRRDPDDALRPRVVAVAIASAYTLALVYGAGGIVLLPAPIFPFTAIGVADHLSERRAERDRADRRTGD
ncbi:MAG TPA: hypothetical protein VFZ77_10505 [Acidimicrobiales bacterium]